ncbi:helix-turn-helix transcriptional regulator [[Mycobacterium] kokjensenii]|uniref:Helix-turn-helix transcriptional regulator n=1 Tax=[Mycobacterium] kokjensenii TaxID=3064287 RepID=A0ABN9N553_9MYCO|nr:helix-turn-helix transcriptional regulator [Mycolicibacter sp. MU0083]CAJ1500619.1 helix-turn-helix transcriptional regulator [Mycolicibacter sp. MU0083]
MNTIDEFSQLISCIYSAVLVPEQWDAVMTAIARCFQAHTASLVLSDSGSRTLLHAQMQPAAAQAYSAHYERLDHVLHAVETGPVGVIRSGAELMWPYQNCEFQIDWARPNGLQDGLFVRLTSGTPMTSLAIASVRQSDRFDRPDYVALITRLTPHLQQALRTRDSLSQLDRRAHDLTEACGSVSHGIVIVDGRRPVFANTTAERVLCDNDGLRVEHGHLTAQSSRADAELGRSIARLADPVGATVWGGSFLCPRPSGRRPYIVHVLPVDPSAVVAPRGGRAMLVIVDPEQRPEPAAALLKRLYGLTKSEAQVAVMVLRGEGLTPIAEELTVSLTTVKTHLQHIYAKTGTHRQAELVRLLFMLDPLHRPDGPAY